MDGLEGNEVGLRRIEADAVTELGVLLRKDKQVVEVELHEVTRVPLVDLDQIKLHDFLVVYLGHL